MNRTEKEKIVGDLQKVFSESKGIYLTDFTGIDVEDITDLRRKFRAGDVEYQVIKNTLARLSIKDLSYDEILPYLNGPTAVAFSTEDELAPGKIISDYQKKTDKLPIKAAIVDGTVYGEKEVAKIVKLPSRNELVAKLLGSLNSPVSGFVMVLNGVLRNFVGVLDALRVKMEESEGSVAPAEKAEDTSPPAEEAKGASEAEVVADEAPVEEAKADEAAAEEQSPDSSAEGTEEKGEGADPEKAEG